MLYTKIQPQSFPSPGEEDFQEFLPYILRMAEGFEKCSQNEGRVGKCVHMEMLFFWGFFAMSSHIFSPFSFYFLFLLPFLAHFVCWAI